MTSVKNVQYTCPSCNTENNTAYYMSINLSEDPELFNKIMDMDINVARCSNCDESIFIDDYVVVNDMKHRYLVTKFPLSDLSNWKTFAEADLKIHEQLPENLKGIARTRIVFGPLALKEKLLLIRDGFDDGPMEVYKISLLSELGQEYLKGKYRIFYLHVDEEDRIVFAVVNMEMLRQESVVTLPKAKYIDFLENKMDSVRLQPYVDQILIPPFVSMEKLLAFEKERKFH